MYLQGDFPTNDSILQCDRGKGLTRKIYTRQLVVSLEI